MVQVISSLQPLGPVAAQGSVLELTGHSEMGGFNSIPEALEAFTRFPILISVLDPELEN